jgi:hypothetical protein
MMDCGGDDYYYPGTPPAANYLATHWNTADSGFLTALETKSQFQLSVDKSGAGVGTVTSSPGGVSCGPDCTASFLEGTSVTLTATATAGSEFSGWTGACSGTVTVCTLSMTTAKAATATFDTTTSGTRHEGSAFTYDGWKPYADASGTYRASNVTGSTAHFSFSGSSLRWLTKKGPAQGKASVTIDGAAKGTVDLYATTWQSSSVSFTGLASTSHKVVVKVLGTKDTSATNTNVAVNGFAVGTATTQENSANIGYHTWKGVINAAASNGSHRVSSTPAATASFMFSGTSVDWITYTGPGWGKAQVSIDGVDRGTVDLYAATAQAQTSKTYGGLTSGTHTITVRVLGTKNAAAKSTAVSVDAFVVR